MHKVHVNDIIKLREKTGFGIFDCKRALLEMKGNFEKAIEYLRKTSINKAYKSSDPISSQGLLLSKVNSNNKKGIIIGINCETDFVAKNDLFITLAKEIAEIAINCNNKNEVLSSIIGNRSIKEILFEHMTIIGEKLTLNIFEKLESFFVEKYVHHGNKIAALVGLSATPTPKDIHLIGKELAMQIVAMNPIALNKEDIPYHILKNEKEILKEQESRFGKSEDLLEKIVQGKINKFVCENTLLYQKYIKNQKITVQNYLKQYNNNIVITGFKRVAL